MWNQTLHWREGTKEWGSRSICLITFPLLVMLALCSMCHTPAVVLLCREAAVMTLEMHSWWSTLGNLSAHGKALVMSLPSTGLVQINHLLCSSFPLALQDQTHCTWAGTFPNALFWVSQQHCNVFDVSDSVVVLLDTQASLSILSHTHTLPLFLQLYCLYGFSCQGKPAHSLQQCCGLQTISLNMLQPWAPP